MRRPVRSPVSRATTAASSSSVCRLPFISSSALPCRTSSTAFARRTMAVRSIDDQRFAEVDSRCLAISSIFAAGPTSIGAIKSQLSGLDRSGERRFLTRMCDGGRDWLQILAALRAAIRICLFQLFCIMNSPALPLRKSRVPPGPSPSEASARTIASATP